MVQPQTIDNFVRQKTEDTGTGNLSLTGVTGYRNFDDSDKISTGGTDEFAYAIRNLDENQWEFGTGHLKTSSTLVRDTIIDSSNSDNAVNFSEGTKHVVIDIPASWYVLEAADIDGDVLPIDYEPGAYTPDADISEADDEDDAAAHFKGIDKEFGSLGGLLWEVKSSDFTAEAGTGYFCDVSGSGLKVTLPSSPSTSDRVGISDYKSNSAENEIEIDRNGNNIEGVAENFFVDLDGAGFVLAYTDSATGWKVVTEIGSDVSSGMTEMPSLPKYSDVDAASSDETVREMERIFVQNPAIDVDYQSGPAHGEGGTAFYGASLAPTGEIIFAPRQSSNIGIYDPVSQTYTSGPAHNEGSDAFIGSALAPTGEIILVPYDSSNIGIYDPVSQTYTSGPSHGEGSLAFQGGVLAPTGEIVFAPADSANIGIYDPVSQTYTSGPSHGEGSLAFQGGALAPTGETVFAPAGSANIGIYDPVGDTYTSGPAHGEGGNAFRGASLAPTGGIILAPYDSSNIGIYDPVGDTYTSGPSHGEGGSAFAASSISPTGEIIFAPYNSSNIGIYDPSGDTYTSGPSHGEGSFAFHGASIAPTGEVIFASNEASNIGVYDPRCSLDRRLELNTLVNQ